MTVDRIQTDRLTLVELSAGQVDAFHAVWSDPEATKWSLHGTETTRESSRGWMAGVLRCPDHDKRRGWTAYVHGALDPRQCIGIITLRPPTNSGKGESTTYSRWELGYLFRPQYWGHGYATEACQAAMDSLRAELEGSQAGDRAVLIAYVDPGNYESLNVLRKLGFNVVGHRKFNAANRFLGGQWRAPENLVLKRDLWCFSEQSQLTELYKVGLPFASILSNASTRPHGNILLPAQG